MKKKIYLSMIGFCAIALIYSCKSKQKAATLKELGETEIVVPCSGTEFQSNGKSIRYSTVGESMDQVMSKNKAYSDARAGLASSMETILKRVWDTYGKSTEHNNVEDLQERYEGISRETVKQTLTGTETICEKVTKTQSGNYKTYICLELNGEQLMNAMNQTLSKDKMLKIDHDYEKYKTTFNEEMEKKSNEEHD